MKKRILSIILTVAMLVAMVPAIAVSAVEESESKTVTVSTLDEVKNFLTSADNIQGNTMKLGANLDYSSIDPQNAGNGLWTVTENENTTYLLANIDGNGFTVTVPGGNYKSAAILTYLTAKQGTYVIKNLTVKMALDDGGKQEVATTDGKAIALFGENGANDTTASYVTFENCCFDVRLKTAYNSSETGSAVLFARHRASHKMQLTVTNCYFKAHIEAKCGHHGALVGRRSGANADSTFKYSINNCVFDISYTTNSGRFALGTAGYYCTAIVGSQSSYHLTEYTEQTNVSDFTDCNNNLIYNNQVNGKVISATEKGNLEGFTTNTENTITTVKGYQTTTVANNKFNLRLVGLVELGETALTDYSKVGFVVVANYANTTTKWTSAASNKVYSSITANTATETQALTATQLGGDHIYALAIKNIPSNAGDITFEVTPYYVAEDGTTTVYGATTAFTVDVEALPTDTVNPTA